MLTTTKSAQAQQIDIARIVPDLGQSFGYAPTGTAFSMLQLVKGTAYAALSLRASKVAMLDWRAYRKNAQDDVSELPKDHWLSQLIVNPNRYRDQIEIWSVLDQWLTVTGNAYLLVLKDQHGNPAEMWPLDAHRIAVIPAKRGSGELVAGYYYYAPTGTQIFGADEVLHIRVPGLSDNWLKSLFYGVGEFEKFSDAITTEMSALLYQSRYFRNNAMPNFVIERTESGAINQANVDLMRSQWETSRSGAENAGKFAILPYGFSFKPVQGKNEIDYLGTMEALKSRICEALMVPPTMLTSEFNSRAASDTVVAMFLQNCIAPRARLISQALTRFFSKVEDGIVVGHVAIGNEDPDVLVRKVQMLSQTGGTANEMRNLLFGFDPVEGGDAPLVSGGLVSLANVTNPPPPPAAPMQPTPKEGEDDKESDKAWDEPEDAVVKAWQAKEAAVAPHRKKLAKAIANVMGQLEDSVMRKVRGAKAYAALVTKDDAGLREAVVIDLEEWADKISEGTEPEMRALIHDAMKQALEDVDWQGTVSFEDKVRREVIKAVNDKLTGPLATVADDVNDIVERGLSEGKTVGEISADIQSRFDIAKSSQADNIAQTTSTATMNDAQRRAWKEAGVKGKRQWLTQRDGDVRPAHVRADGQEETGEPFAGTFNVGGERLEGPALGNVASNNCQCRCFTRVRRDR